MVEGDLTRAEDIDTRVRGAANVYTSSMYGRPVNVWGEVGKTSEGSAFSATRAEYYCCLTLPSVTHASYFSARGGEKWR